jgi:predicted NUDIX family NTP pyrophosphohydrolase
MTRKQSAGILLYRSKKELEVFLVHPGGPFFKNKDEGTGSIPKGEYEDGEDPLQTAKKEFKEETGSSIAGTFTPLKPVKQKGGKMVIAWAVEGDIDETTIRSNDFEIEWPPRKGKKISFPEVDKGDWFTIPEASKKINPAQIAFLEELSKINKASK